MYDFIWNLGLIYLGIYIGRQYERKPPSETKEYDKPFDYSAKGITIGYMPFLKRTDEGIELFDAIKVSFKKESVKESEKKTE